jgi:regulator of sigma E protease
LSTFVSILIALLALSIIIIVHETGHFLLAKACGIRVLEFGLFMGPKIFSREKNGTIYSIRAIPIGGFVAMEGEEENVQSPTSYSSAKPYKKLLVALAGPFFNIVFAFLVLTILFASTGYALDTNTVFEKGSPLYEQGLMDGDEIISINGQNVNDPSDITMILYPLKEEDDVIVKYKRDGKIYSVTVNPIQMGGTRILLDITTQSGTTLVATIDEDSNGYIAGLRANDEIIAINDESVSNINELSELVKKNGVGSIKVTVLRVGAEVTFIFDTIESYSTEYVDIGVYYYATEINFFQAVSHAITYSFTVVKTVILSIVWMITGIVKLSDMMGPVGIISTIGEQIKQPTFVLFIINLCNMMAFISINLGTMNLIPFPALDGSKVVIHVIEWIKGKPFNQNKMKYVTIAGFVILLLILVLTTFNDIMRLIKG